MNRGKRSVTSKKKICLTLEMSSAGVSIGEYHLLAVALERKQREAQELGSVGWPRLCVPGLINQGMARCIIRLGPQTV